MINWLKVVFFAIEFPILILIVKHVSRSELSWSTCTIIAILSYLFIEILKYTLIQLIEKEEEDK